MCLNGHCPCAVAVGGGLIYAQKSRIVLGSMYWKHAVVAATMKRL